MNARNARNSDVKDRIVEAAIDVIAMDGISRATHRKIADSANVSLSSTTYHYASKADITMDAVKRVLGNYVALFRSQGPGPGQAERASPGEMLIDLIARMADDDRNQGLAWCEIILESSRTASGHEIARSWYDEMDAAWQDFSAVSGMAVNKAAVQCLLSIAGGMLFLVLPLGLSAAQIRVVMRGADPASAWAFSVPPAQKEANQKLSRKSLQTRETLIDAVIELLLEAGVGAVTYPSVAQRSGASLSAPTYHFGGLSGLLGAAEARLFSMSSTRYRDGLNWRGETLPRQRDLADVVTTILIRESTEFGPASVAHYAIWAEAARNPELRPMVSAAVGDRLSVWQRQLSALAPVSPAMPLICEAFFIGWSLRIISTGAPLNWLAATGRHLELVFRLMLESDGVEPFLYRLAAHNDPA